MKTLGDYLSENLDRNVIDHRVRCIRGPNGETDFYIHPDGHDGDTPNFTVSGNNVKNIPDDHGAGSRPPMVG